MVSKDFRKPIHNFPLFGFCPRKFSPDAVRCLTTDHKTTDGRPLVLMRTRDETIMTSFGPILFLDMFLFLNSEPLSL